MVTTLRSENYSDLNNYPQSPPSTRSLKPGFRIFNSGAEGQNSLTQSLDAALRGVVLRKQRAEVATVQGARRWPRGLRPILPVEEANRIGCVLYGLEVRPVYLDPATGDPYPRVANELRRSLSVSLRRFFFDYARSSTTALPVRVNLLSMCSVVFMAAGSSCRNGGSVRRC